MGFLHQKEKALSIVELMVVVTIVAIIAAVSISVYTKHLAKQVIINAINATGYLRQAVEDYYQLYGYFPGSTDLVTGPGGPYISYDAMNDTGSGIVYLNYIYSSESDIVVTGYIGPASTCSAAIPDCVGQGYSQQREIGVGFGSQSIGSTYLAGRSFRMQANLNGGVIDWVCAAMVPSDSMNPSVDPALLPARCHLYPSLDVGAVY